MLKNIKFQDKHFSVFGIDPDLEENLQKHWNGNVIDYDKERFPFDRWMLERVREHGYDLDDLTRLHEVVPDDDVFVLTKKLCHDTHSEEFQRMVNNFIREVIVPQTGLQFPVAVQRFLNVRIMLPNKPAGTFPFHQGLLYGHGPASHSMWMPLTDVSDPKDYTATLQMVDIHESRKRLREAIENQLEVDEMTEFWGSPSFPILAKQGQVCCFSQENIHGNFVNVTGKTRVSIDFRIAQGRFGDHLARKIPGGYFKVIADTEAEEAKRDAHLDSKRDKLIHNGKRNILYVHNATTSTRHIPVHLQRYMLYEYAQNNDLKYEFEFFELEDMTHLPTLRYVLDKVKANVVLYSVYCLPEDPDFRRSIVNSALENGVVMHFVNEELIIADQDDVDEVEELLSFAKYGADEAAA